MIATALAERPIAGFDPTDWWGATDREILACLERHGSLSIEELCEELGLSKGMATAVLSMLAREGRVRICQVALAA